MRDRLARLKGGLRVKTIAARVKTTDARVMTPVVLPVPRPCAVPRLPRRELKRLRCGQRFQPPEPKHPRREPKHPRRVQRLRFPEPKHLRREPKHLRCVPKLLLHERKRQPRARKVLFSAPKDRVAGATAVALVRIVVLARTGDQLVTRTGEVVMTVVRVVMTVVAMGIGTEAVDLVVMSRASAALIPLRCKPQSGRRRSRRPISSIPMTAASSGKPGPMHAPRPPGRAMRPRRNPPPVVARWPLPMTVAIVAHAARCGTVDRQAPVRFACTSTSVAATTSMTAACGSL